MSIGTRQEWLTTLPKQSVGAEIGVAAATFSALMIRIVDPRLLYLVDRYALIQRVGARAAKALLLEMASEAMAEEITKGRVRLVCAFSVDAAKWVADESLDWVYIDADHKRPACMADLKAWYPKVKVGGLMAGHDYVPSRGPYPAVQEFVKKTEGLGPEDIQTTKKDKIPSFWFRKPA